MSKKLFTFLLFICLVTIIQSANSQMVYVPDANFRTALFNRGFFQCLHGDSIDSSCPEVVSAYSLDIWGCGITNLQGIEAFSNLLFLYCYNNNLTTLPPLPPRLQSIRCENNRLTSIPQFPDSLTFFNADDNLLTSLPAFPSSLLSFRCDNNHLTSLPALPSSLTNFDCNTNQLTALPSLPSSVFSIYCRGNQITSIPPLPSGFRSLNCDSNLLTDLPALPDSLNYLYCQNNPFLDCLPYLPPHLDFLVFANSPITCVPNYVNVGTICDPLLTTLPFCDVFNSNGCDFYWNIRGKSFLDLDSNCVQSSADTGLINFHLMLLRNGNLEQQAFTDNKGYYYFDVDSFDLYTTQADTTGIPFNLLCPASAKYSELISIADSIVYSNDFALKCKDGFDLGAWSITASSGFRPGRVNTVTVRAGDIANYYGAHCANGINGTLTIYISGNVHYMYPAFGALYPTIVSGNILTYNISDFGHINSGKDFSVYILTDSNAVSGSTVCVSVSINVPPGDFNYDNNFLSNCYTIRSGYDPNFKLVFPEGIIDTSVYVLTYTIQFQNTGTDTAENIFILDTLDNSLDVSSFQLLASSHPVYVRILEGGIARFNFANINLPDSTTNEYLSYGYIQYKVKLKDNLSIGTQIQNSADIYFDFNAPVATNTTLDIIDLPNKTGDRNFSNFIKIWPIPFDNYFILETDAAARGLHFAIVNLLGSEMKSGTINSTQLKISTDNWASGIYFLRVEGISGSMVRKLIKK